MLCSTIFVGWSPITIASANVWFFCKVLSSVPWDSQKSYSYRCTFCFQTGPFSVEFQRDVVLDAGCHCPFLFLPSARLVDENFAGSIPIMAEELANLAVSQSNLMPCLLRQHCAPLVPAIFESLYWRSGFVHHSWSFQQRADLWHLFRAQSDSPIPKEACRPFYIFKAILPKMQCLRHQISW